MKDPKRQIQGAQAKVAGEHFEQMIEAACKYYEDNKIALIEKTPEPMRPIKSLGRGRFIAYFEKQGQPDYKGTAAAGRAVVFEAKHTDKDRIEQSRLTDEQKYRLRKHSELGAVTFILVSIGLQNFYRVPWIIWENMKKIYGRKYMSLEELRPYKVKVNRGVIRFLDGVREEGLTSKEYKE